MFYRRAWSGHAGSREPAAELLDDAGRLADQAVRGLDSGLLELGERAWERLTARLGPSVEQSFVEYTTHCSAVSEGLDSDFDEFDAMRCIVCGADEVDVAFPHHPSRQRRVAIARRAALCATCIRLIKSGQFAAAANRGSDVWDDFERDDLLDVIEDLSVSIWPIPISGFRRPASEDG